MSGPTDRGIKGRDFDCIVVGAGVVGSAAAALLLARKLAGPGRVAVVAEQLAESSALPDADWGLRVYALSRASQRLLTLCGAWPLLPADRKLAYERMCVWDAGDRAPGVAAGPAGTGSLTFDCAELGEPNLGYIVEGRALQTQCRRAAVALGVVFIEATMVGVTADAASVRLALADGRELHSRLVIAADGVDSKLRDLLGIDTAGHVYHQDALVAHVRTARPHCHTAWQRFLPTGPLAFLPLPDGRSSIVWSVARDHAARLRALDAAAFGAALSEASGEVLGACELTTAIASFPLQLQYALDYVRPRAVLVGDAAHAVHPLAGQNLNLGLLDCAALADVLGAADAGPLGEPRPLRRYERWRRGENRLMATAMDGLERLFSSRDRLISLLRIAGVGAVGRVPFVRRELARRALGLAGDIPSFLQSDPES